MAANAKFPPDARINNNQILESASPPIIGVAKVQSECSEHKRLFGLKLTRAGEKLLARADTWVIVFGFALKIKVCKLHS